MFFLPGFVVGLDVVGKYVFHRVGVAEAAESSVKS
jgi:hypothetical protein